MTYSVAPEARSVDLDLAPARGLLTSLTWAQLALSIVFGAVPSVLLALQVQDAVGDDRKVGVLAVMTTAGALAAMVCQLVIGMLSDRTRSRWGSRLPWMLGGTIAAAPITWAMGTVDDLVLLGTLFVLTQLALGCAIGPFMAVVPDRVGFAFRGRFSAAIGLGVMIGSVAGQALGSVMSKNIPLAYVVLGLLPVLLSLPWLLRAPDPDNRHVPVPPIDRRALLGSFWIDPKEHADFWWSFSCRLFTYTGFFMVYGYTLYILTDYIGMGDDAVKSVPLVAGLAAVGVLVTTVPSGLMSDRTGRRKPFVLLSSVGMGVAFLVPVLTDSLAGLLVMAFLAGMAFGCYQSVDSALIADVMPRSHAHAQDMGIVNVAGTLPQVLAPAIAGAVVITVGYVALFPVAAVFAALGGLSVLRVRSVR